MFGDSIPLLDANGNQILDSSGNPVYGSSDTTTDTSGDTSGDTSSFAGDLSQILTDVAPLATTGLVAAGVISPTTQQPVTKPVAKPAATTNTTSTNWIPYLLAGAAILIGGIFFLKK